MQDFEKKHEENMSKINLLGFLQKKEATIKTKV